MSLVYSLNVFQFILFLVAGASMGSFASAVIYRARHDLSFIASSGRLERSFCPNCKTPLVFIDLIPLISWMLQKGQCRYCQKPIPKFYPLLEGSAVLMGGVVYFIPFALWDRFVFLFMVPFILSFIFLLFRDKITHWRLLIPPFFIVFFVNLLSILN